MTSHLFMRGLLLLCALLLLNAWWPENALLGARRKREKGHALLQTPGDLQDRLPLPLRLRNFINASRAEAAAILEGKDDRLLVVVGPCSIHDLAAAREYAHLLRKEATKYSGDLFIVMRTYLEKPRTSVGWRGLVSDPDLSGREDLERGLEIGRRVLLDVNAEGLPAAVEFLDPLVAPYLEDLVTYGSIGARTVESPMHRALAASLPMPIGFKNSRDGQVQSAVNAAVAALSPQRRIALDAVGRVRVMEAAGNPLGHIILRGGEDGPNYDHNCVSDAAGRLAKAGIHGARVVVDFSHGNSGKRHEGQVDACHAVAEQLGGNRGAEVARSLGGVMIESFLEAGNQPLEPGVTKRSDLRYGCSVTDACLDFEVTKELLVRLAEAVRARRALTS